MAKKLTEISGYKRLVKKIQAELSGLDFFIKRRTVQSYWRVGKFIHEYLLDNKDRVDYGSFLLERLADEVDRDASTLSKMLRFYRAYPILARGPELSWSHYRILMGVKNKQERQKLEQKIISREWGAQKLQEALRLVRLEIKKPQEKPKNSVVKLNATRSRLFTYRILEPDYITSQEGQSVVDLGFSNNIQAEIFGVTKLKPGEIIETAKSGNKFSYRRSDAKPKELYTYVAQVERVVDADTIWLNIDCGFRV